MSSRFAATATLLLCAITASCAPRIKRVQPGSVAGEIVFWSSREGDVVLGAVDGTRRSPLAVDGRRARFFPDGQRMICSNWAGDRLMVINRSGVILDSRKTRISVNDISNDGANAIGTNTTGTEIHVIDTETLVSRIVITPKEFPGGAKYFGYPSWSPIDPRSFYVMMDNGNLQTSYRLYRYDLDSSKATLMFETPTLRGERTDAGSFSVSPDGKKVVVKLLTRTSQGSPKQSHLHVSNMDGSEMTQITHGRRRFFGDPQWSPNGEFILAIDNTQGSKMEAERGIIVIMRPDGSGLRRVFKRYGLFFEQNDSDARWCPR